MFVSLLVGVLVTLISHWFLYSYYSFWRNKGVPTPRVLPFVGNIGASVTASKPLVDIYDEIYKAYKDYLYIGIYQLAKPTLFVRDIELVKTLMIKDFSHFHDNDVVTDETIDPLFSRSPFLLKGERWRTIRGQVSPALTAGKIKTMFHLMCNIGKTLVSHLENETNAQNTDTKEICGKFTTDVVANCAFGLEGNSFSDPNSIFRSMGRNLLGGDDSIWTTFKVNLLFAFPALGKLIRIPFIAEDVQKWFTKTILDTMQYREKNQITRNDYLDYIIGLKTKKGEYEFTDLDVAAQAFTLYFDGYETSAIGLSFILYEIANNPREQKQLQEEVDRVLAKNNGEITYELIQEMNYLDMVFHEALRLHPPVSFMLKTCTKDYELPPPKNGGRPVQIETGTSLVIPSYSIHHDPEIYPNPYKFNPENFTEKAKNSRPKCSFLSFGEGPRQCLGIRFATAQLKSATASIVYNFDISVNSKTEPGFVNDPKAFVLGKKGGIWLDFHKRNK